MITLDPLFVVVANVRLFALLVKKSFVTLWALLEDGRVKLQKMASNSQGGIVDNLKADGAG